MRSNPPDHERSWRREDIFLPVRGPRVRAAAPQIQVAEAAYTAEISVPPQLRPVAAASREPARARKKASPAESTFELSISAAASSRQSRTNMESSPIFSVKPPFSEIRRMILRRRLFVIFREPKAISTTVPTIWQVSEVMNPDMISERLTEKNITAAEKRSMINADLKGILMPLLQQAAEARYMSILTINASKNSLSKVTPPLALYSSVHDRVISMTELSSENIQHSQERIFIFVQ